jgi:integrase
LARTGRSTQSGFRTLRRPKVPRHLIAPFSDPELRSVLALADERERALALVLLDTGLRLSELASLTVADVRPDGTLHVMGKGAKERIVPVGSTARRALVRYLATMRNVEKRDPLFDSKQHHGLSPRGIQLAIARLGRRAGVGTRCSPHTFRHTLARGYLVNGGDGSACSRSWGTRRSTWSAATCRSPRPTSSPATGRRHRRIGWRAWGGEAELVHNHPRRYSPPYGSGVITRVGRRSATRSSAAFE